MIQRIKEFRCSFWGSTIEMVIRGLWLCMCFIYYCFMPVYVYYAVKNTLIPFYNSSIIMNINIDVIFYMIFILPLKEFIKQVIYFCKWITRRERINV